MLRLSALVLFLLALLPEVGVAQSLATLVADRIDVTATGRLEARGNVEVFHEGTRLSAASISYDPSGDLLLIEGPIFIVTPSGDVLAATRAQLDPRLENGILRGARLVLDRQLQLAANRIDRVDGRLSQLSQVVATSCSVCSGRAPLWEIRARRVIHDEDAQQLHFEGASLRIRGVPVLWLPWMRLPDPTLDRATGMMVPELRVTSNLGAGLAVPVFITLGPSRDLRLTPYVSAMTRTLEARFRHALLSGSYELSGALSDDELGTGSLRGYLSARGDFRPRPGTRLSFNLTAASDRAYLGDYGISGADRLPSRISFSQVRADSLLRADLTLWQSLRIGESSRSLPPVILGAEWERRLPLGPGMLTLAAETLGFARIEPGTGDDSRDVLRIGAGADWRGSALFGGAVIEGEAGLALQWRRVTDDPVWDESLTSAIPHAGVVIRYPLVRHGADTVQTLEPALAIGWARRLGDAVPPEDTARRDLDRGNILSPLRGAGEDLDPPGASAAALVTWTRTDGPDSIALSFGALVDEARPDPRWLLSGSSDLANGFRLTGRALFDGAFDLRETETIIDWQHRRFDLTARHLWLAPGSDGGTAPAVSEIWAGGAWRVGDSWEIRLGGRYDIEANAPIDADLGIGWANECVTVDVSLSHRYTEAGASDPATRLGLAVRLTGFSTGGNARRVATCTG